MPELISVELGLHVAGGKDREESTVILKRREEGEPSCVDLPKLTTLRTNHPESASFRFQSDIELDSMCV